MLIKSVCIIGGSGFVGHRVANRLSASGFNIRIPTRNRKKHKQDLILLPGLELIQADVHNETHLNALFEGCDAVINLAGILNERRGTNNGFRQVHVELPAKIINACRKNGIKRLLHMSALNADINGPSQYLRSKGEAERLLNSATDLLVTSYRPSVIFGPGDSFFNRFASLLKISPLLPLACPGSRFAPVFVGDVAEAMALTLVHPDPAFKQLHLCGPEVFTLQQLVVYTVRCLGIKRIIVPLPDVLSRLQASVMDTGGFLFDRCGIEQPFSTDNYMSLQVDSVASTDDLTGLGILPTPVNTIVPHYLARAGYKSE